MKLRNLMFIGVAAAAMFVGCKEEEVLKPAAVEIQPEALTFTTEAETKEVSLLATRNWKAEVKGGGDWLTVEPMSGEGSNDAQTVRVSVIKNEEGPKAATVIFSASNLETELKVTQDGVEGGATTIAYFLAQEPSDEVWYTLTGEITEIKDTKYGNFTIKDETGSVYVYGLTEEKTADGSNDQSFKYLNLKVGDKLTLCGTRAEFKGEAQVGGTAYYISHVSAPVEWPEEVTPISEILEMTESDVQVQTTGIVYGTYKKGVVIKDKETGDYLIVYDGGADAPFAEIGDEINVVGTTYLYNDQVEFMEINYLEHKVVSKNNSAVETDAPAEITAATIDAFDKTKASYISFEGILTQSGNYFNVIIDGADFTGSLSNVIDPSALADYVDKKVVVTGYYCSTTSQGKYFNIMYTDIDIVTEPWVYLPETSFSITSDAQPVKFTVNSNSAWTIASSDPAYTVSPEDGANGTAEVTVTCPENTGTTEKVVTLTITAGEDVKTVTITQAAPLAEGTEQVSWGIENQTWGAETHSVYGAGFSATDQKIKVGFYKHESSNDLKTPSETYDAIRVYKDAMLVIEAVDGKKVKSVVMETEHSSKYCSDMTVTGGTKAVASTDDWTITWTGSVDVFEAQASSSQVRITKLTVIYGD